MAGVSGNIVLVGETGVGKSSIINMIAGTTFAQTSSGATGCTFQSHSYILRVHSRDYRFFDTAGLEEGERGTVERPTAIANLYKLINGLEDGISLLMFCMRGPRIKNAMHQNWKLFHEVICKKKIPTLLVVTGLENEESMDNWWVDNRGTFENQGIHPNNVACITAIRGRSVGGGGHAFDDYYEESRVKILNKVFSTVLPSPRRIRETNVFVEIFFAIRAFFGWSRDAELIEEIKTLCGFSPEETKRLEVQLNNKLS